MAHKLRRITGTLTALWILYTLYQVIRYGGAVVVDPDTTARIMAVRNDAMTHSAIGLTYHGFAGAALVIAETLLILAALIGAFLLTGARRRACDLLLLSWTLLWLGNALWLQTKGWDRIDDVAALGAVTIVLAVSVALSWRRTDRRHKIYYAEAEYDHQSEG
jgi:hypothetical protein